MVEIDMASSWLERTAEAFPLSVYRVLFPRKVFGFLYHMVSDEDLPHVRHLYPHKTIAMFERDLAYLQQSFHLISYHDLLTWRAGETRLEFPAALLSFDDGYSQCYSIVRSMLLERGIPAVFFINTGGIDNACMLYRQKISLCIDKLLGANKASQESVFFHVKDLFGIVLESTEGCVKWMKSLNYRDQEKIGALCQVLEVNVEEYLRTHRPYLSAQEIRTMAGEGFTIGGHTRGHPKLNLLSPEEMEEEIAGSCEVIRGLSGQENVPFAFPFSAYGVPRETLAGILSRHAYIGMLFDSKGIRRDRSFIMNRIMADKPFPGPQAGSDLPHHLHRAYEDVFLLKVRRRGIS